MKVAYGEYIRRKNLPSAEEISLLRRRNKWSIKQMALKIHATSEIASLYESGLLANDKQYKIYKQLITENQA